MNQDTLPQLNILSQLDRLNRHFSTRELSALKDEILHNAGKRVVHIWDNYHLFDQLRYEICQKLNISFTFENLEFADWIEAAIYMCEYHLKNSQLTCEYKKYIIGQLLNFHIKNSGNSPNSKQSKYTLAAIIGKEYFIATGTVLKYGFYSDALNVIYDQEEKFARNILMGKVRISHENLIELSHLKPEEIKSVAKAVSDDSIDHISLPYIRNEVKWSHIQTRSTISRRERAEMKVASPPAITQMPTYDPDSEVNSLCMTIDSWLSSIQRVSSSNNFPKITSKASLQLMRKLSLLEHTINTVQESIVERTNHD